ncbi:MAG: family 20 glycosylhydrolase [Bacteroidota bacterium]
MKHTILSFITIFLLVSCDNTTAFRETENEISLLPHPKEIQLQQKEVVLTTASKLFSPHQEVYPLLELLSEEVALLTSIKPEITPTHSREADIILELDPALGEEDFQIDIQGTVQVKGGSYHALTLAKTSLLQLVGEKEGQLVFPVVSLKDQADASYRGLMIDLARKWHEMGTVKKLIDLAAFYKLNYVQLHFTDYQSYTLPSKAYPKLSTPNRHYSFEELAELEAYSQERGITIIPEIDVPGHSSPFVRMYPEIFALADTTENPYIINMGKEAAYEALDVLIGELTEVFQASPYFHIGGDEAMLTSVAQDPFVKAYVKEHGLGEDPHEIYRHFLVRMNEIVKKHGKQTCVWEGFTKEGEVQIPKDMLVFEFETNRYLPNELVADGYTLVNTSWKPLYVVNKKKWEPKTIYEWNMWRWENWWDRAPSFEPIQLEVAPQVIGAQMCAWEQPEEAEIPSLRKRIPAFAERIWNTEQQITYEELMKRMDALDQKLSLLIDDDRQDSLLVGHNFEAGM